MQEYEEYDQVACAHVALLLTLLHSRHNPLPQQLPAFLSPCGGCCNLNDGQIHQIDHDQDHLDRTLPLQDLVLDTRYVTVQIQRKKQDLDTMHGRN